MGTGDLLNIQPRDLKFRCQSLYWWILYLTFSLFGYCYSWICRAGFWKLKRVLWCLSLKSHSCITAAFVRTKYSLLMEFIVSVTVLVLYSLIWLWVLSFGIWLKSWTEEAELVLYGTDQQDREIRSFQGFVSLPFVAPLIFILRVFSFN